MKRIFIVLMMLTAAITLSAKVTTDVATNPITGMTLKVTDNGIYALQGPGGAMIIGKIDAAKEFMASANKAFKDEIVNNVFDCGAGRFEVGKDDDGLFIIKVGLFGAAKLRPTDTAMFGTVLGVKKFLKQ